MSPRLFSFSRPSLWIAMSSLAAFPALARTVHVKPDAPAGADGSERAPFATLEAARDALRSLPREAHTVLLHPGIHLRSEPFLLTDADSGTPQAPIRWKALHPRQTVLDASRAVPFAKWERPNPTEWERLDEQARSQVRCLDLSALGTKHSRAFPGKFAGRGGLLELHAGEERQPLSRWPDGFPEKSALMGEVLERGSIQGGVHTPGRFQSEEDRCKRWRVESGVWLEGYWRAPWDPVTLKVAHIEAATRMITFAEALPSGIGSKYAKPPALGNRDEPWWAINLPEEITQPGEWAVDFPSQRLFWWPPNEESLANARLSDMEEPLVQFQGVAHVHWEGVRMVRGLGNALDVRESRDLTLAGLEIALCGGHGIAVSGGSAVTVLSNDLHELGEAGIVLSGGDRKTLTPCNHLAQNNHIWKVGVLRKTYAPGILIGLAWGGGGGDGNTVGCRVRHNLIHDTPHCGILYGGNDHLIELNEVARTVLTSHDMGAIYTQGDWASQGNQVRNNFIHDSPRAIGVYLDDGDSGDTVEGNLFVRNINGVSVCGGHHNLVRGNLVFECNRFGLFLDARGIARAYDLKGRHAQKLNALPFQAPPWLQRYPKLATLLETDPRFPRENEICGNVVARCPKPEQRNGKPEELQYTLFEANLDMGQDDPGFVNALENDFRLRADAPLLQQLPRFQAPPFLEMGLERDAYRPIPVNAEGNPRPAVQ